jgi:predicted ATPase/class 3 adenylate cyclase
VAQLPSGTVTFLFTDIEDSTRLWREHPESMRAALARHDAILAAAVLDAGGAVVKTTGDGVHAVFADARDAIHAAIDAQVAVGDEPWSLSEPLLVRMGIHSGTAELRGGDYYGTTVNRAARLMSAAHGGQIVVSHATEELAGDGSFEMVDLGEHSLRGLGAAERVFQVADPRLHRTFPALRSAGATAGNLPVQVTSFVGRDEELASIPRLFDDARLVTLVGPGGVGKTRLALQVGEGLAAQFADGVWFCELGSIDDGAALPQVIATATSCRQRQGMTLLESVIEFVRSRELLLVLDNCEHLLDDAADFADSVLRGCPSVLMLATSREALAVGGERVVRLRSLDVPEETAAVSERRGAAVQLFVERARDTGATLSLDEVQWAAIGEICRRVDGIPLAIELAAARVESMSPREIAAHLDESFRLLTGRRRGRVERHRTLHATVDWSYQLLDANERLVFDRLGVFSGSFDTDAVLAVVADDDLPEWAAIDAIASLVAKSMLSVEPGLLGTTRYAQLETMRQFARERLYERGDVDNRRRRMATHCAELASQMGFGFSGPDQAAWTQRMRVEADNLRAAVLWALDADVPADQQLGVRIIGMLASPGRDNATIGIEALAVQAVPLTESSPPSLRAKVLSAAAYHEWELGNIVGAREFAEASVRCGVAADVPAPLDGYLAVMSVELSSGNYALTMEVGGQARAALDKLATGDVRADLLDTSRAHVLGTMGCYEGMLGDYEQAQRDAEAATQAARRVGAPSALIMAAHARAWAFRRDDLALAIQSAEEATSILMDGAIFATNASGVVALTGGLHGLAGDDDRALETLRWAVELGRDFGTRPQLSATLDWCLRPLMRAGDAEAAAVFVGVLEHGVLADVGKFPGAAARTRSLDRARTALGADAVDACLARGAAFDYDEMITYALEHLTSATKTTTVM